MKILWLTEYFPKTSQGEITGGVEARCFFVDKYLKKFGQDVKIIAQRTTEDKKAYLTFKTLVTGIPYFLKLLASFFKELNNDFDLVEGTNYTTYPLAWLIGHIKRKPVVFWYPDVFIGDWLKNVGPAGIFGELLERIVLLLPVNRYIAISNTTKKKLEDLGITSSQISTIPCGIDPSEFKTIKNPKKEFDIGIVCRLVGYKRVQDAVEALSVINKQNQKIKMLIIGQGPEKVALIKLVKSLNLETNVKFLNFVPAHREVLRWIKKCKIICLPSIAEGFGIIIIEAAALGVPTVVSKIPVLSEVTNNGEGGLLFEPKNSFDLADKIMLLLKDSHLYKSKSEGGRNLAKRYDWEKIARETLTQYQKILKGDKNI